jgi:translation initiation factor IF-3
VLRALASSLAITSRALSSSSRDATAVVLASSCVGVGWRRWVAAPGSPSITASMPWAISAQLRGVSRGGGRGGKREDVTKKNLIPAHRINEQIESRQVRLVIDSGDGGDGESSSSKSHEVISTIVARKRAKEAGLDLVEMNAKAVPPVCRMLDYDAFRYELRLKEKEARKKAVERRRHDQVKELRLSARISANDLGTKADQANKFLEQGHKVTARIEFKSNDGVKAKMRPDAGAILYAEFRALLNAHRVEVEPKMVGPSHMILQIAMEREKKGSTKKKEPPVNVKKEETPVEKETAKEGETATVS